MIRDQEQIGKDVLDFLAVIEAHAAEHAVRQSALGKRSLQCLRLRVHAIENGKISVMPPHAGKLHHLVDDQPRLIVCIVCHRHRDLAAGVARCPKRLTLAPEIVSDHRVCRIKNVLC